MTRLSLKNGSGRVVSDEEFLARHSEKQRDEESPSIIFARPDLRDFSLTSVASLPSSLEMT